MNKYAVKISDQGQITLPKALREKLGAKAGERVILTIDDVTDRVNVSKDFPIEEYFGSFGDNITGGKDATEYIRELRDENNRARELKDK